MKSPDCEPRLAACRPSAGNPLPMGTSVDYLAQQMRGWFETLGYRFESRDVHVENCFEWIIDVPGSPWVRSCPGAGQ